MLNYQRVEDVISGKLSEIKYQLFEQVLCWMMLNYRHIDIDYGIANVLNYPDTVFIWIKHHWGSSHNTVISTIPDPQV